MHIYPIERQSMDIVLSGLMALHSKKKCRRNDLDTDDNGNGRPSVDERHDQLTDEVERNYRHSACRRGKCRPNLDELIVEVGRSLLDCIFTPVPRMVAMEILGQIEFAEFQ